MIGLSAWIAFTILSLSGCATLPTRPLTPPKVVPVDLRLVGGGLMAQDVNLNLLVQNPNPFPISLEGITARLWINGQPLADGTTRTEIELPAYGSQEVRVRATIGTVALLRQIALLGSQRPLTYRLEGRLWVKRPFLPATQVPFRVEDRLDFWNFFNRQAVPIPYRENGPKAERKLR